MEDMGNYGYTLFRTIPVFSRKRVRYTVSKCVSARKINRNSVSNTCSLGNGLETLLLTCFCFAFGSTRSFA